MKASAATLSVHSNGECPQSIFVPYGMRIWTPDPEILQWAADEGRMVLTSDKKTMLGYAYARAGRRQEAEKLAIDLSPQQQSVTFAGLGDKERTLEALDRMAVVGPVRMGSILSLPELALLRGDPRLKALRKKVGLPE